MSKYYDYFGAVQTALENAVGQSGINLNGKCFLDLYGTIEEIAYGTKEVWQSAPTPAECIKGNLCLFAEATENWEDLDREEVEEWLKNEEWGKIDSAIRVYVVPLAAMEIANKYHNQ